MHATKRHGRAETRVLYWFRTPPYVKVGRPALDEDTMRLIEARYPDLSFDWARILRDPPQQIPEDQALRRREHRDARDAKRKKKRPGDAASVPRTEFPSEPDTDEPVTEPPAEPGWAEPEPAEPEPTEPEPTEPEWAEPRAAEPGAAEPAIDQIPASELLGTPTAAHLRNRYVVLMQRIDRLPDEAVRERLRVDAAPLNPNGWESAEAVRSALEGYEALFESIRSQAGGGRRRRRRRRGRGKSGGEAPPSTDV